MSVVYLNGRFLPLEEAVVSVEDRGFLFGDACYEATPVYGGACFRLDDHLARLQDGLDAIRVSFEARSLRAVHDELIRRNGLTDRRFGRVYAQVTRGAAPRAHGFPAASVAPTVYAQAAEVARPTVAEFRRGSAAITHLDLRWSLPRIKSTGLLPNVLATQAATEAGAVDVVLHRDGYATEGAHNNLFIVRDGALVTPPADDSILDGVTRRVVIERAAAGGLEVVERPIELAEVFAAEEVFFTGTTTEVRATVSIDGRRVGAGVAGPVTTRVHELFVATVSEETGVDAALRPGR